MVDRVDFTGVAARGTRQSTFYRLRAKVPLDDYFSAYETKVEVQTRMMSALVTGHS